MQMKHLNTSAKLSTVWGPSLSLARAPITPSTPAVGPGTGGEHDLFLSLSAMVLLSTSFSDHFTRVAVLS